MPINFLRRVYAMLHPDRKPYAWQEALYERLIAGDPPASVTAPTGAGKTSLISLWLIGLAWQARENAAVTIPRRLVWVVNRRVVVDQATAEAENLRKRIAEVPELKDSLKELCLPTDAPLAISTLRGQFADNREWVQDPTRPAIIIGTVDMIGSRLLFSGYGDGFRTRPHHAGLLGYDALLVNDEAHLTPAFASLLTQLSKRTRIRAMHLSATPFERAARFPASFADDLADGGEFPKRYCAPKALYFHEVAEHSEAEARAVTLAIENPAPRTILFVTKPEHAASIAGQLRKKIGDARVKVLTGTQRGDYRDSLDLSDFSSLNQPTEPCWLVSTAAGEVGLDATCARLITLLDTADHLIQRFGRLNRFGETSGEAHLVYVPPKEKQVREAATLRYLRSLPVAKDGAWNISAETLFENPPPEDAITEVPPAAPLSNWVIDRWTLTTAGPAAKPRVENWLHGKQENMPETYVAWRRDVTLLAERGVPPEHIEKALRIHPLKAHEVLREPTYRLQAKLEDWTAPPGTVILQSDGSVCPYHQDRLNYGTLILPPGCGGLEDGMFTTSSCNGDDIDAEKPVVVADVREYLRATGLRLTLSILLPSEEDESEDTPVEFLVYANHFLAGEDEQEVTLRDHQRDVAAFASQIAAKAEPELREAFKAAGQYHDEGKRLPLWQVAMGCSGPEPLAKSSSRRNKPKMLGGFRHELLSLRDARDRFKDLPDEQRDLALHLIACHHGQARPYFPAKACGPESLWDDAREALLRFARLQKRHGPWRLAYLEALFRSADWLASRGVTPRPEEGPDDEG